MRGYNQYAHSFTIYLAPVSLYHLLYRYLPQIFSIGDALKNLPEFLPGDWHVTLIVEAVELQDEPMARRRCQNLGQNLISGYVRVGSP